MRYYQAEHEAAYRTIAERGDSQWNDLFDQREHWTYDHFQNRPFLERILPQLVLPTCRPPQVLEYGCGTGPAACFLAARGFQVDAIDLIPEAITIARRMAHERGVEVTFRVADVCELANQPMAKRYDIVLDSFCLQSIVTDVDRAAVFGAVRSHLTPNGSYVISTALRPGNRAPGWDGRGFYFDDHTGVYYREIPADSTVEQAIEIGERWFVPYRRHLSAPALRDELTAAGFHVVRLEARDEANVLCVLDGA